MNETTPPDSPGREAIASVLGRTPSGLFILTATDGGENETGMLASWVQQASFEPPTLTVAVNRQRYLHEWLERTPFLGLSLLGSSQKKLLGHFARGFEPGQPAFDGLAVMRGSTGVPLLREALGALEGEVTARHSCGDHVLYVVQVVAAHCGPQLEADEPWVHVRKNAFRY